MSALGTAHVPDEAGGRKKLRSRGSGGRAGGSMRAKTLAGRRSGHAALLVAWLPVAEGTAGTFRERELGPVCKFVFVAPLLVAGRLECYLRPVDRPQEGTPASHREHNREKTQVAGLAVVLALLAYFDL